MSGETDGYVADCGECWFRITDIPGEELAEEWAEIHYGRRGHQPTVKQQ